MSSQNFASYGDMETLMAGIKSAIDDAGGGGGSLQKVVVKSVNTSTDTIKNYLMTFHAELEQLTDEQRRCCFLDFYGTGSFQARFYFLLFDNDNHTYFFENKVSGSTNVTWGSISSTNAAIYLQGTSIGSYMANNYGITKIELSYMAYRSAVVPSGETVVASYNNPSYNLGTALNYLYANVPALTNDIKKKLKLRFTYSTGTTILICSGFGTMAIYFMGEVRVGTAPYIVFLSSNSGAMDITGATDKSSESIGSCLIELYYEN